MQLNHCWFGQLANQTSLIPRSFTTSKLNLQILSWTCNTTNTTHGLMALPLMFSSPEIISDSSPSFPALTGQSYCRFGHVKAFVSLKRKVVATRCALTLAWVLYWQFAEAPQVPGALVHPTAAATPAPAREEAPCPSCSSTVLLRPGEWALASLPSFRMNSVQHYTNCHLHFTANCVYLGSERAAGGSWRRRQALVPRPGQGPAGPGSERWFPPRAPLRCSVDGAVASAAAGARHEQGSRVGPLRSLKAGSRHSAGDFGYGFSGLSYNVLSSRLAVDEVLQEATSGCRSEWNYSLE